MWKLILLGAWPIVLTTAAADGARWPDFVPGPDGYSPALVATVQHAWTAPTLHRAVDGPPAPMPLASYLALVDAPDVTAAAARHLGLASYHVRAIAPGWYEADDDEGARGVYLVLTRRDGLRVTVSWGRQRGRLLGTITGSALSVMRFEAHGTETLQHLDTYVVIDDTAAALLARTLVALFGRIADRKLAHGFAVTAKIAGWIGERPDDFCRWLAGEPLDGERRQRLASLGACDARDAHSPRSVAR